MRLWRLSADKKRIEPVGVLGRLSEEQEAPTTNGTNGTEGVNGVNGAHATTGSVQEEHSARKPVRGIINDIAVFERGERAKDGLSIVCGVGRDHRLGRWRQVPGGRNGGVVFEVPRIPKSAKGVHNSAAEEQVE